MRSRILIAALFVLGFAALVHHTDAVGSGYSGCPTASATAAGCVNTTTQTFAGAKTFNGAVSMGSTLNVTGTTTLGTTNAGTTTIGSSGTAISNSIRGTVSWTPGAVNPGACANTTVTVTGATAGTECLVGIPGGAQTAFVYTCFISANTCALSQCNWTASATTGNSGTYSCRVFNP